MGEALVLRARMPTAPATAVLKLTSMVLCEYCFVLCVCYSKVIPSKEGEVVVKKLG
jgi:hypothetical protein